MDIRKVEQQWKVLQRNGILDYQPRKDKPQIYFIQERITVDYLQLDIQRINTRKESYKQRIDAITKYAENTEVCRSKMLLAYFDEEESLPCGICDVCIRNRKKLRSSQRQKELQAEIKSRLSEKPLAIRELLTQYSSIEKESMLLALRNMLDEEKILVNSKQELVWREKKKDR